ncbi:epoxyqueuosine reductase QueH [Marinitoga aeolica]|uniref:Epoxyqueuosine reductase QueH n=1 Tax=Marinitoga aeolica TaxID=2809031 RepID=A0ABY8PRL0_9BACT|nr:epoxyqueuosine reductase QueH [Marinitoga aeolica]WGS65255.1 epoxyqueuosine reductase QueH [Marinitoga aeolica]
MKIFLHVCCAPDLVLAHKKLMKKKIEYTAFFYNPNIYPYEEYKKRYEAFLKLKKIWKFEEIEHNYDHGDFLNIMKNVDTKNENIRCYKCMYFRMEKAVVEAKKRGYKIFSTTLLSSPRKNHEDIKKIASELSEKYDIEFYYENFRSNNAISKGAKFCKANNIYRQQYCGCEFSLIEAEELRKKSFEKRRKNLSEKMDFDFVYLMDRELLKIPEDLYPKYLYKHGLEILKDLKPKMILIRKDIAKDLGIKNGRNKIGNWKSKFIVI